MNAVHTHGLIVSEEARKLIMSIEDFGNDRIISVWVDCEGNIYKLPFAGHADFAEKYTNASEVIPLEKDEDGYCERTEWIRFVEQNGWVHISGSYVYSAERPNKIQREKIEDFFTAKQMFANFRVLFQKLPNQWPQAVSMREKGIAFEK